MTIHANLTYLSKDVSFGESLELEHIIAKKRIQAAEDGNKKHLLGGNLGNCMYLPRSTNNSKKDKTLYEVNEDHRFDALIKSSAYFSETEMEELRELWMIMNMKRSIPLYFNELKLLAIPFLICCSTAKRELTARTCR